MLIIRSGEASADSSVEWEWRVGDSLPASVALSRVVVLQADGDELKLLLSALRGADPPQPVAAEQPGPEDRIYGSLTNAALERLYTQLRATVSNLKSRLDREQASASTDFVRLRRFESRIEGMEPRLQDVENRVGAVERDSEDRPHDTPLQLKAYSDSIESLEARVQKLESAPSLLGIESRLSRVEAALGQDADLPIDVPPSVRERIDKLESETAERILQHEGIYKRLEKLELGMSEGFAEHGAAWAGGFEVKLEKLLKRVQNLETADLVTWSAHSALTALENRVHNLEEMRTEGYRPPVEKRRFPSSGSLADHLRSAAWVFVPRFTAATAPLTPFLRTGPAALKYAFLFGVLEAYQRLTGESPDNVEAAARSLLLGTGLEFGPSSESRLESWLILQIGQALEKLSKENSNG